MCFKEKSVIFSAIIDSPFIICRESGFRLHRKNMKRTTIFLLNWQLV